MDSNNVDENSVKKVMQKKKGNSKIVIMLLVVIFLLGILGFCIKSLTEYLDKKEAEENKKLAQEIFEQTGMNEYLKSAFIPGVVLNQNLLNEKLNFDLYNNDSITKYNFSVSMDESSSWVYVKYVDYAAEYEKTYGKKLDINSFNNVMGFSNLKSIGENHYTYDVLSLTVCSEDNLDICYVGLGQKIDSDTSVVFSEFDLKNDVVVGEAILTYAVNGVKTVQNGEFELKYSESNGKYVAESIKFTNVE